MNKRIDFTNNGGFPLEQDTLDFMQQSYRGGFAAVAKLLGEKTILTGVVVANGNVSDGWIVYNGELVPFVGGSAAANVSITEVNTTVLFEDGTTPPVYFTKTATCAVVGNFPFTDLVRLPTLLQFLINFNGHTHTWASITGKPVGSISYVGSINLGNPQATQNFSAVIPNQGNTNYMVSGTLVSNGVAIEDNNLKWQLISSSRTPTGFTIATKEDGNASQNVSFEFAIIKY